MFAVVHVLLTPGSGYAGNALPASMALLAALHSFSVFCVGFWAYFRPRSTPARSGA